MGCFSFNGNKIITTGGGGMITTDDERLAVRARHLTTQARLPGPEYRHDEVGFNYRLTNLGAAVGVAQLEQLPRFLQTKADIAARYDATLTGLDGLELPRRQPYGNASNWLYSVLVDSEAFGVDRVRIARMLAERGIETRPIWSPLHSMPLYANATRLGGQVSEALFARGLSLPSSVGLSEADQLRVIEGIRFAREVMIGTSKGSTSAPFPDARA
jgi:dTDP-4-amino-4,6-dideoxygalactose transaminase